MPISDGSFDDFADILQVERGPRALFIVGTSRVDYLLIEILKSYFLPKCSGGNQPDELLDGDTPLGTFSSRIKICRRIGLINDSFYSALEKLRAIRNLSAHGLAFNCHQSPLREHIAELRKNMVSRESFKLTRKRYFEDPFANDVEEWQCLLLAICVLLEAIRESTQRVEQNLTTSRISAK
jgi:hypothetical protein